MDLRNFFARIRAKYDEQAKPVKIIILAWVTLGVMMTAISSIAVLIGMITAVVKAAPETLVLLAVGVLVTVILALGVITVVILRKKGNTDDDSSDEEDPEA